MLMAVCTPLLYASQSADAQAAAPKKKAAQSEASSWRLWTGEAKGEMVIMPEAGGDGPYLLDIVRSYEDLTGIHVMASQETRTLLENTPIGIEGELRIEAKEVSPFLHSLLRGSDFAVRPVRSKAPRVIGIVSMRTQARNTIRGHAPFVSVEELEVLRNYPALIVSTALTLDHLDVRQLSNSLRTMITDANTEQMIPAGATNTLILTGFPDRLEALVNQLRFINAEAKRQVEPPRVSGFLRLHNATARDVAATIQRAYQSQVPAVEGARQAHPFQIVADERTNAIVVHGSAADLQAIKALALELDVKIGK
ncbi:MAG: hypothetical protein ACI841_005122 [Planctomycetota bacterium]